jgi:hypothetical protein
MIDVIDKVLNTDISMASVLSNVSDMVMNDSHTDKPRSNIVR